MSDITDLIATALDKQPDQFNTAFSDIMADKVAAALEVKKQEIAQSYMADYEDDEEASEEEITDTEEEDGQDSETNS